MHQITNMVFEEVVDSIVSRIIVLKRLEALVLIVIEFNKAFYILDHCQFQ